MAVLYYEEGTTEHCIQDTHMISLSEHKAQTAGGDGDHREQQSSDRKPLLSGTSNCIRFDFTAAKTLGYTGCTLAAMHHHQTNCDFRH